LNLLSGASCKVYGSIFRRRTPLFVQKKFLILLELLQAIGVIQLTIFADRFTVERRKQKMVGKKYLLTAEALADISFPAQAAVPVLVAVLEDESERVRLDD
jgi:hypothetical protein